MKRENWSGIVLLFACFQLGFCRDDPFIKVETLGGSCDYKGSENDFEIESLGRFAVEEHNRKEVLVDLTLFYFDLVLFKPVFLSPIWGILVFLLVACDIRNCSRGIEPMIDYLDDPRGFLSLTIGCFA